MNEIREMLLGSGYEAQEVNSMSDAECVSEWDELCSQYMS